MAAVSAARAARLLVTLRWRRVRNRLLARGQKRPPRPVDAPPLAGAGGAGSRDTIPLRGGTATKSRNSWLLALGVGFYLPFMVYQQTKRALEVITARELGVGLWAQGDALPVVVIRDLSIEGAILVLTALLMSLATNKELSAPEWDLEWMATLPIPGTTLLGIRILERALVNPAGFGLLWPFATMLCVRCGFGFGAPLLAAAVTLPLLVVVATIWTVLDTSLRLALAAPQLRNLQALITLGSTACLVLAVLPSTGILGPIQALASVLPAWFFWTPAGLAVRVVTRQGAPEALRDLGWLVGEALVLAAAGVAVLSRLLRLGIVSGGGRESGRRARAGVRTRDARAPTATATATAVVIGETGGEARRWLSALQRRELRLLGRDRNFLVQTLLLPVLIVGVQIFLRTRMPGARGGGLTNPAHVAAAAFGISAYAMMFSAFQTLNAEGQALWILCTLPYRLETLLRQKAALWAGVSLIFPAIVLGLFFGHHGVSLRAVGLGAIAIVGVPIFAGIATALGVFASDPLAAAVHRRVRPAYVYLYMALGGMYTFALYASGLWQRGVLMVLTALVALALWQKARDQLPYLLDPAASPPARVSVADGLIAAMLFFVTQAIVALIAISSGQPMSGRVITQAFMWAGAVTFAIMRFAFWRLRSAGVPRLLGARVGRAVIVGVAGAALAAAVGLAYLLVLRRLGKLPAMDQATLAGVRSWLLPLAIVAAPIFEEFIFRGLIFGGLRRTFGGWPAALASAGIFAIVHPPLSAVPVFCMGLIAARVYDRAAMLLAPMLVHAGYNAAVSLLQPWLSAGR
jgi:ABC-2 type transport system permease protein